MGVPILSPKNDTEEWLLKTVSEISAKVGIKTPEFGIFNSQQLNAFATGSSKNNSLVAISSGLVSHMSRGEIEAVIAHEISHISNGDMITMTLIQGIINTFVIDINISINTNKASFFFILIGQGITYPIG